MYWEVGIKIGAESGQVTVHPAALQESAWDNAVEHVMDMAAALYPKQHIELEWVKEFDNE
tara:strand:+ start:878 stop:1057 length:180 start_codon:yes stop_codon:yes gene_type:complete